MRLLDLLFPPRADEIALRDISPDEFLRLVAPRLVPDTRPGTVALLPFSSVAVRSAIHEAKYHGSRYAFELLALALIEYLHDLDDVGFRKSHICIVPIPLGKMRRKERGFNQIEEITRRALRILEKEGPTDFVLAPELLTRTRETASQVSLARDDREENMRGAFATTDAVNPSGTYIIIDDVITTGATLQAAIDALKAAGAVTIVPLALAH